eukprot:sb/3475437/
MDYEDMIKGMELCARSRDKLLRNRLEEAKEVVKDTWQSDMYGAMAYCNIGFSQSIMTFDRKNINQTILDLDASLQFIQALRHKDGMFSYLMSYVKNRDFSTFSEVEKHAELMYAELLLVRAVLTEP